MIHINVSKIIYASIEEPKTDPCTGWRVALVVDLSGIKIYALKDSKEECEELINRLGLFEL